MKKDELINRLEIIKEFQKEHDLIIESLNVFTFEITLMLREKDNKGIIKRLNIKELSYLSAPNELWFKKKVNQNGVDLTLVVIK